MAEGSYNQFCPVAMAAEILCTRWTIVLLRELVAGSTRFNELRRGAPRMSPALLSKRLKDLEAAGVVTRSRLPRDPEVTRIYVNRGREGLGAGGRGGRSVGPEMGQHPVFARKARCQPADVGHSSGHQHDADAGATQYDPDHLLRPARNATELVVNRRAGRGNRFVLGRSRASMLIFTSSPTSGP